MSPTLQSGKPQSIPSKWLFPIVFVLIILLALHRFYISSPKKVNIAPPPEEQTFIIEPITMEEKHSHQIEKQVSAKEAVIKNEPGTSLVFKKARAAHAKEEGLVKAPEALQVSPPSLESERKRKSLAKSFNSKGWELYGAKNYEAAMKQFESSLDAIVTAEGYFGRGMLVMAMGDNEEAIDNFESSLALAEDGNTHMMMGVVLYTENRLQEAKNHFEKALALDTLKQKASVFLSKIDRELIEDSFRESEGSHFVVRYEGAERGEAGYTVSLVLEEAYFKIGSDLGFYPEDVITAILYSDQQFRDVTKSPSWSGGLYDGKIRLPTGGINGRTDDLKRLIYHEYTHALIHRMTGGNCPAWLNEGIAQYEEGGASRDRALALIRGRRKIMRLKDLEAPFAGLDSTSASVAYATSFLAVDYLVSQFGLSNIRTILDNLNGGMPGEGAVSSASYMDYPEIEEAVLKMAQTY